MHRPYRDLQNLKFSCFYLFPFSHKVVPQKASGVVGGGGGGGLPNQVLTHAARAAAKQLNFQPPLVAARGAREGLWLEQGGGGVVYHTSTGQYIGVATFFCIRVKIGQKID